MKEFAAKKLKKDKYNSIEELFNEWKKAHLEDVDEFIINKTFSKGMKSEFKGSFCFDGYIGERKNVNLLFICRESNVDGKAEINDTFWIRQIVNERKTKYFKCINGLAEEFNEDIFDCAYININKRGGISRCCMNRLKNYAALYENYILKEIELLKPKKIIILGNMPNSIIEIIKKSRVEIYKYPFHPCVYRKNELAKIKEYKL